MRFPMANDTMRPAIHDVTPVAAIPGGEFRVTGEHLANSERPQVYLGGVPAPLVISSPSKLVVKVPEGATIGEIAVQVGEETSHPHACEVGIQIADGLHPVTSPAVDQRGYVYSTLSGQRGQKTPVSVYEIDLNYNVRPIATDIMNATGLTVDSEGRLYVSSRYDGIVYEIEPGGQASVYVEGMGVATGLAFDREENLYVGDRSGTIFKISRDRQIYVFATLESSIAAYHLAFGPGDALYVTGPTTSSFDAVYRIDPNGDVEPYFRGLGRPQGLAVDEHGNLYVAASLGGKRGVIKIDPDRKGSLFVSGTGIVGVAFSPSKSMILTTTSAVYRLDVGIRGLSFEQR